DEVSTSSAVPTVRLATTRDFTVTRSLRQPDLFPNHARERRVRSLELADDREVIVPRRVDDLHPRPVPTPRPGEARRFTGVLRPLVRAERKRQSHAGVGLEKHGAVASGRLG